MRDCTRTRWAGVTWTVRCTVAGLMMVAPVACAHHGPPELEEQRGPAQLTVENQEFPDFDIYVVTEGGLRLRLGLATGHATTTFEIPTTVVDGGAAHLHFIADPVAGQAAEVGEMVVVNPGDDIQLTLAPY
jgi:hypothetical protein